MKKFALAVSGLALTTILAAPAQAAITVIDFDAGISGPSYSEAGVTFTPILGGTFEDIFGDSPNGTRGLLASPFSPIEAVFSAPTDFVSVDMGDYNTDEDDLFLRAFDMSNTFLGEATLTIPATFTGMETLSVSFANIARVEFGGVGGSGSSVYSDNFTFNASAVPEPASWAMMIFGFMAAGTMLRTAKGRRHGRIALA